MMPFHILTIWLRGLLSIAIIAGGLFLLKRWYDDSHVVEVPRVVEAEAPAPARADEGRATTEAGVEARAPVVGRRVFRFEPGANRETAYLAGAVALLAWAAAGRWIGSGVSALAGGPRAGAADEEPRAERTGEVHTIRRPGGRELRVECYGPPDAPPVVMTHGWGANSTEWYYEKKALAGRFRLIVWDEPGLGLSPVPADRDYRLEALAADLEAVLGLADRPAVLVGHSIGGMITLTFCRLFPEALGSRVAGLVLAHTTYTNPVRTTKHAALFTALEKPVIVPLLHLTVALWPLVWLMNWLSYVNGSAHRSTHRESFAGTETRGQLDFAARFMPHARPDVLARGMFGMLAYDATDTLPTVPVPTLVVVGDRDTTTLPEAGAAIARGVPSGELATLAPAKHMGLIEHHRPFDERLAAFATACLASKVAG